MIKLCKICGEEKLNGITRLLCRRHNTLYFQDYRAKNRKRNLEIHRKSRRKIYKKSAIQRWKDRANHLVYSRIKSGKLKRQTCEVCGKEAQAHHDSYLKDNLLNVRFLCIFHHSEWHRLNEPELPKL